MRALILLASISAALAASLHSGRIVGGVDTTIQSFPFMANMNRQQYGWLWQQACGGSLITPTSILSAAHCYEGDAETYWCVRLGSDQRNSGGTIHYVDEFLLHPQYSNLDYDVAIVYLETPAIFTNNVKPARIGGVNYNLADGASVVTVGWGHTSYDGFYSETLQYVTTNIIKQDVCAHRYAYLKTLHGFSNTPDITPQMLCSGILNVGGKDACQGDSGGPLLHQGDIVIGVVSWGFECADHFYPGIYARMSALSGWVQANAK